VIPEHTVDGCLVGTASSPVGLPVARVSVWLPVDMRELFLRGHAVVHGLEVGQPEGWFSPAYGRLHGLADVQLRLRPQGWNSIA